MLLLLLCAVTSSIGEAAEKGKAGKKLEVEYEATPHKVVDAMLKLAKLGPDDFLIDLGSGDGRIPIAAAKTYGAKALGVDLDPKRVAEAKANAEREGVTDKVTFVEGDLHGTEIGDATVVTLFLWPTVNLKLRPRLLDLAPGKRVVSHAHDMGDWHPDRQQTVGESDIFLWIVPAQSRRQLAAQYTGPCHRHPNRPEVSALQGHGAGRWPLATHPQRPHRRHRRHLRARAVRPQLRALQRPHDTRRRPRGNELVRYAQDG